MPSLALQAVGRLTGTPALQCSPEELRAACYSEAAAYSIYQPFSSLLAGFLPARYGQHRCRTVTGHTCISECQRHAELKKARRSYTAAAYIICRFSKLVHVPGITVPCNRLNLMDSCSSFDNAVKSSGSVPSISWPGKSLHLKGPVRRAAGSFAINALA